MQRAVGSVRNGDQVIGAESLPAPVAVELIAAGTEQCFAARIGTGLHGKSNVPGVFVILHGKAVEVGVAGGASGGIEVL
jgi:hypothetical protein